MKEDEQWAVAQDYLDERAQIKADIQRVKQRIEDAQREEFYKSFFPNPF